MNPAYAAADAAEEQEKNISGVVSDFAAVLWIRCWGNIPRRVVVATRRGRGDEMNVWSYTLRLTCDTSEHPARTLVFSSLYDRTVADIEQTTMSARPVSAPGALGMANSSTKTRHDV